LIVTIFPKMVANTKITISSCGKEERSEKVKV
jgi:hypothetical protein